MSSLSGARTRGKVGSILVFFPILDIVGFALVLTSINDISKSLGNKQIFSNALAALGLIIVGLIVGFFAVITGVAAAIFARGLIPAISGFIVAFVAVWIFWLAGSIFLRRSYDSIASGLGIDAFRTAGLLYLVGAALAIVFGIGFIIIFVAEIFQAVGFFSMPQGLPQRQTGTAPPATDVPPSGPVTSTQQSVTAAQRYCSSCGAPAEASAKFCRSCGKPL